LQRQQQNLLFLVVGWPQYQHLSVLSCSIVNLAQMSLNAFGKHARRNAERQKRRRTHRGASGEKRTFAGLRVQERTGRNRHRAPNRQLASAGFRIASATRETSVEQVANWPAFWGQVVN
jgi:hypothetical protein